MKRIIFIMTMFFTVITKNSGAQEHKRSNNADYRGMLMFGCKLGGNLSNVYDSKGNDFEADPKLGIAGGGFISIPIGKYIGIQPEALFSQKGFQGTSFIFGNSTHFTRTSNYFDLPLFFALKPHRYITLLAGPQYSYLLNQRDVFDDGNTSVEQQAEFENNNIRKNTLCFSGGLDLTLNHFVLSGRTGWDVQSNNGDGSASVPRYKNVWYQLTAGFRF